jgi:hypothetical protein
MNGYKISAQLSTPDDRDILVEKIFDRSVISNDRVCPPYCFHKMQEVRSQGHQGSCTSMALASVKEWHEKKDLGRDMSFSPQFLHNFLSQPESSTSVRNGMKVLMDKGICQEQEFRYGLKHPHPPSEEVLQGALNFRIAAYARIKTIAGLKQSIYVNGPAVVVIPVFNHSLFMWKPEKDKDGQRIIGYHAMAVQGYNQVGIFIRNSWGKGWGYEGNTFMFWSDFVHIAELWTCVDLTSTKINYSMTDLLRAIYRQMKLISL